MYCNRQDKLVVPRSQSTKRYKITLYYDWIFTQSIFDLLSVSLLTLHTTFSLDWTVKFPALSFTCTDIIRAEPFSISITSSSGSTAMECGGPKTIETHYERYCTTLVTVKSQSNNDILRQNQNVQLELSTREHITVQFHFISSHNLKLNNVMNYYMSSGLEINFFSWQDMSDQFTIFVGLNLNLVGHKTIITTISGT